MNSAENYLAAAQDAIQRSDSRELRDTDRLIASNQAVAYATMAQVIQCAEKLEAEPGILQLKIGTEPDLPAGLGGKHR